MSADRKARFSWAVAVLPAVALVAALVYSDAWRAIGVVLQRVGAPVWCLALLGQALSYAARAARLQCVDRGRFGGRYGLCLRLTLVNTALNLALPLRAGEASFPLLLRRWFGVELVQGTGTLIWMRLLDLQVLSLAGLLCLVLLGQGALPGLGRWWMPAMLLLLLAPLLLWWLRRPLAGALREPHGRLAALMLRLLTGLPDRARLFAEAWLWTLLAWAIKLAGLGLLLAALAQAPQSVGMLGAIGGDLSTVLPLHSPGGFGSFEAGVLALTSAYRPPTRELLSAALSFHLFVLGCALSAGLAAWIIPGAPRATPAEPLQS